MAGYCAWRLEGDLQPEPPNSAERKEGHHFYWTQPALSRLSLAWHLIVCHSVPASLSSPVLYVLSLAVEATQRRRGYAEERLVPNPRIYRLPTECASVSTYVRLCMDASDLRVLAEAGVASPCNKARREQRCGCCDFACACADPQPKVAVAHRTDKSRICAS